MHSHVQELQESAEGVLGRRRYITFLICSYSHILMLPDNHLCLLCKALQAACHAGVYASQTRDDFSADDVEHYFNYMGMLAIEVGP